jgi:hypothetical protein
MSTEESKPSPPTAPDLESTHGIANFGKVDYGTAQGIRFYANHAGVSATLFDIRLLLSDVDVSGDGVKAVQTLAVLMSPELAHLLYMALGKTLKQYGENYGKTRLPSKVSISGAEVSTAPESPEK